MTEGAIPQTDREAVPAPGIDTDTPGRPRLIALIGARGSGKTTVAQALAQALGWKWLDADDVLESRAGRSVRAIFAESGEAGFRERETAIIRELCSLAHHVIATGGGAVVREENRKLLKASAHVVWLTADVDTLWHRLETDPGSGERRPALLGGGRAEIEEVLRAREALYRECAHSVIATGRRSPPEIVADILAACTATAPRPTRE